MLLLHRFPAYCGPELSGRSALLGFSPVPLRRFVRLLRCSLVWIVPLSSRAVTGAHHPLRETIMKVARILVVHDSPQSRRVMKAALTKQGYIVEDARSGEVALEKIREERYDLIILDRNMPGIGGVEACRSIRED